MRWLTRGFLSYTRKVLGENFLYLPTGKKKGGRVRENG